MGEAGAGPKAPWPAQLESKPQLPLLGVKEGQGTSCKGCGPPSLLCLLTTGASANALLADRLFPSPGLALLRMQLVGKGAVVQTTCVTLVTSPKHPLLLAVKWPP